VVTLVDYGRGNLFSVQQALEKCGASVRVIEKPEGIAGSSHLVLPGVGSFAHGMRGLEERGFVEPLREFARSGRPFLGICLGMQMMFELGREFGEHRGLGLIHGAVEKIPDTDASGAIQKIPHIGWSRLEISGDPILEGIHGESTFYFVHSYEARPADARAALAHCPYGGRRIVSVVRSGNAYGCQFHPEKSAADGLRLLSNFVAL
jgi:glutamine amidotransferase